MKANEAPEKIYVADTTFPDFVDFDGSPINTKRIDDHDIEYIRTDAFIKKFECWMNENFYKYSGEFHNGILAPFDKTEDAIENFKKFIEV